MIRDYWPIMAIFSIVSIMVGLLFIGNITIEEDKKYEELFFENPSDMFDSPLSTTESFSVRNDSDILIKLLDFNIETQLYDTLIINLDYYKEIPCPQPHKGIQLAVICFEIKEKGGE